MFVKCEIKKQHPSFFQYSRPLFFHKIQYWAEKTLLNQALINQITCIYIECFTYAGTPMAEV